MFKQDYIRVKPGETFVLLIDWCNGMFKQDYNSVKLGENCWYWFQCIFSRISSLGYVSLLHAFDNRKKVRIY